MSDVGRRAVVEEDRLCAPLPVPLGRPVDRGEVVAHQLLRAAAVVFDGALREQPQVRGRAGLVGVAQHRGGELAALEAGRVERDDDREVDLAA